MKVKKDISNLVYIGHVAVFYIPLKKMEIKIGDKTPREMFHDFFIANYNAYTHESSKIQGFWRDRDNDQVDHDWHERYEVSFKGKHKVKGFVAFLSEMCQLIEEDCIYVTMGYKAWLVKPNGS